MPVYRVIVRLHLLRKCEKEFKKYAEGFCTSQSGLRCQCFSDRCILQRCPTFIIDLMVLVLPSLCVGCLFTLLKVNICCLQLGCLKSFHFLLNCATVMTSNSNYGKDLWKIVQHQGKLSLAALTLINKHRWTFELPGDDICLPVHLPVNSQLHVM